MLAVVIADIEVEGEYEFTRQRFGGNPEQLRLLSEWLLGHQVEEVVMESTAQYWQPVWGALERYWKPYCQKRTGAGPMSGSLHLAQARSNRGRRDRKKDFPDAERLVKRLVAQELTLSFVPDAEHSLWRTVARRKQPIDTKPRAVTQPTGKCVGRSSYQAIQLGVGSVGAQCPAHLNALAEGETNPLALPALADGHLRATEAQLCDAPGACTELNAIYRRLLKMALEELQLIEEQRQTGAGDGGSAPATRRWRQTAG